MRAGGHVFIYFGTVFIYLFGTVFIYVCIYLFGTLFMDVMLSGHTDSFNTF